MASLRIGIDLSGIGKAVTDVLDEQVFPNLSAAVGALADATATEWKSAVMKAKLWQGEKEAYIASIKVIPINALSALVEADYKHAYAIENGRPPRDLKDMLRTSTKVRTTKDGRRYLIIPFRHNTPGNSAHAPPLPQDIYAAARKPSFVKSKVVGQATRVSGLMASDLKTKRLIAVPRNIYQWGSRLRHTGPKKAAHHTTSIYDGLVKMDTSAGKSKSSAYLTFRVMMEGSNKWIVPAQPGMQLALKTSEKMQPLAEKALKEAMKHAMA